MTIRVYSLWRHPIKSHGRERLEQVTLTAGQTFPFDRHWALLHAKSKLDPAAPEWMACRNFVIGAVNAASAGTWAELDEDTQTLTLQHAALGEITLQPDDPADQARLIDWINQLELPTPATGIAPHVPGRGYTDDSQPTVTLMNMASHAAVEGAHGAPLELERWRGNIWVDGAAPWAEFDWIDRDIQIGTAVIRPHKRTARCKHTMANPRSGTRDVDTLTILHQTFGHRDFGVAGVVVQSGHVAVGDSVQVL
ncbi:MAG: MOSC domain-containing protein [Pseudomonadota bacterium]